MLLTVKSQRGSTHGGPESDGLLAVSKESSEDDGEESSVLFCKICWRELRKQKSGCLIDALCAWAHSHIEHASITLHFVAISSD